MADDMMEKASEAAEEAAATAADVADEAAGAVAEEVTEAAETAEETATQTRTKRRRRAAATVEATAEAAGAATEELAEGKKGRKPPKSRLAVAMTDDLEAVDAEVQKAAEHAKETIDDAVKTGEATAADIRKALEDLMTAIENQKVFADMRRSFDEAMSAMKKSKTADFVQQTVSDTATGLRRHPFRDMMQRALFAGIGAAALTRDEAEAFVNRLVQRGDIAESDAEGVVEEVMASSKKRVARLNAEVERRVRQVIDAANLPSTEDVEDLNAKIAALQRKVEELSQKVG